MADTNTTFLNLVKVEIGSSGDTWGTKLNANADAVDALFDAGPVLKVTKGGTGATTAAAARTNLGLVIGTNIQAWDADLDAIAALAGTSGLLRKTGANAWALDTTAFAPLASPTFSGTPAAPTAAVDTNTTQLATTAYVMGQGYLKSATAASTYLTAAFPSGTRMLFQQTAAPTGWTKDTTHNDKALRVVSGAVSSGGTSPFSTAFANRTVSGNVADTTASGTVGGTALTEAQLPSHRHFIAANDTVVSTPALSASNYVAYRKSDTNNSPNYTLIGTIDVDATLGLSGATGSGATHTHSFTGTAHNHSFSTTLDMAVQYVDLIIASKD